MAFDLGKEISTQVKTRVFKKVVGGVGDFIRGIPTIGNSSDTAKLEERTKYNTTHLSFPLDVESGRETGNHGHYIMFFINEQNHAKLKFGDSSLSGIDSIIDDFTGKGGEGFFKEFEQASNKFQKAKTSIRNVAGQVSSDLINLKDDAAKEMRTKINKLQSGGVGAGADDYYSSGGSQSNDFNRLTSGGFEGQIPKKFAGISVKRAPTRRLKTAISMYMPMDVSTSYQSNYTDTEIGMFSENVRDIVSAFVKRKFTGDGSVGEEIVNMDDSVIQAIEEVMLSTASALPGLGGTRELEFMRRGVVYSNRMELAFQGVEKRKFTYTFKMIPRSEEEAEEIRNIIYAFKFNMLPEIDGSADKGRKLIVPNTFDIVYMYNGSENEFLHKISTCVLEGVDVKYGGDKFQTFTGQQDGAPVVETTITLNFKEMEPITRERVVEGF